MLRGAETVPSEMVVATVAPRGFVCDVVAVIADEPWLIHLVGLQHNAQTRRPLRSL